MDNLNLVEGEFSVYTDGSCSGTVGGWGFVIYNHRFFITGYGGGINTTTNQMEMYAAIMALRCFKYTDDFTGSQILIKTDSRYLHDGITNHTHKWENNGYRTANGRKVLNKSLWLELVDLQKLHAPEWEWVKGHSGVKYNEHADMLANQGRKLAEAYTSGKKVRGGVYNFYKAEKKGVTCVTGKPVIVIESFKNANKDKKKIKKTSR